jgi:pantoate--beta-alanine ligase
MGFLHDGHISLIKKAITDNDRVLVTLFVNPTQFSPTEDLAIYPRALERDAALCKSLGVSAIFNPEPEEMYPPGFATEVMVNGLSESLCGRSRPNHFKGVATVVTKLLVITEPHRAYFGLKDAQQFYILSRMAQDLNLDVEIISCPIVREADGLAMSSRNNYLEPEERAAALVLNKALTKAQDLLRGGEKDAKVIVECIQKIVSSEPLAKLDYAEVVETTGLTEVKTVTGEVLVGLAVFIGKTRLIDNFIFRE